MKARRERAATIYSRPNGIFVVGEQALDDGMRVGGPPYERLPPGANASEVGSVVARALRENRRGAVIPDEEISRRTWQPVLDLAGVRTSSEFHRDMAAVQVTVARNRFQVYAMANLGSAGGIAPIEPPSTLVSPSDGELGRAVLERMTEAAREP